MQEAVRDQVDEQQDGLAVEGVDELEQALAVGEGGLIGALRILSRRVGRPAQVVRRSNGESSLEGSS